jgi:putative ABC transport system permease protein
MNDLLHITPTGLALGYLLLILPLGILLYLGVPILKDLGIAVVRMTVQLLFVGLYLQVVFELDHPGVNLLWLLVMVLVADASVLKGCGLRRRTFGLPLFGAILAGTAVPALVFTGVVLRLENALEAQYIIPVGGMILGNCLRADIIGLNQFYTSLRKQEKIYLLALAQGATRDEALRPFFREAVRASLAPTIATMATIGLVSLPGMMTGVILAGADPSTAIRYQIAIMIAIFSGTALTVFLAIRWTLHKCFNRYGVLIRNVV